MGMAFNFAAKILCPDRTQQPLASVYLRHMRVVCLTGGIGSGKSTVAQVFRSFGVPVFDSDSEAKLVYHQPDVRAAVIALAGEEVFEGNALRRDVLAAKVFSDEDALRRLNAIIHPAVRKRWQHWLEAQTAPYVIREAAIMLETGTAADCDTIILISAPEEIRIRRVMQRDCVDEAHVRARLSRQWTDAQRRERVHVEWVNDGASLLLPEIVKFHESLIATTP
jgi:dephospho-CoA kinase